MVAPQRCPLSAEVDVGLAQFTDSARPNRLPCSVALPRVGCIPGRAGSDVIQLDPMPDSDKSMRGLKTSIGRIASGNNLKIDSWTDEAQDFLYVRKSQ